MGAVQCTTSSISGLYSLDANSIHPSCVNKKCLQILPNVPGGEGVKVPWLRTPARGKMTSTTKGTKLIKTCYEPQVIKKDYDSTFTILYTEPKTINQSIMLKILSFLWKYSHQILTLGIQE